MAQTQGLMDSLLKTTEEHLENIIVALAKEHGFDAESAIEKHVHSVQWQVGLNMPDPSSTLLNKKGKKVKAKKDPNKPKKAKNAYMFYSAEKNAEVKTKLSTEQDDGTLKAPKGSEVAKAVGKMWQDLSEAEKQPYVLMYTKDKERYEAEMEAYNTSKGE